MRLSLINLIAIIILLSCNAEQDSELKKDKYHIIKSWSDPSQPVIGIDLLNSGDSLFIRANFKEGASEISPAVADKVEPSTIIRYTEANNYNGEYYIIRKDSTLDFINSSDKVFRTISE